MNKYLIANAVRTGTNTRQISELCKPGTVLTANEWYDALGESDFKLALFAGILTEAENPLNVPSIKPGSAENPVQKASPTQTTPQSPQPIQTPKQAQSIPNEQSSRDILDKLQQSGSTILLQNPTQPNSYTAVRNRNGAIEWSEASGSPERLVYNGWKDLGRQGAINDTHPQFKEFSKHNIAMAFEDISWPAGMTTVDIDDEAINVIEEIVESMDSDDIITCNNCNCVFDHSTLNEVKMGYVECPECGHLVDQMGNTYSGE